MKSDRSCGILLHPTSLPSRYGIGDLGQEAYNFIDFLARSGQKLWQILPLNPPGLGQSPYQCFSAFAGNPLLIAPDKLVEEGLLDQADLVDCPAFDAAQIQFAKVEAFKRALFRKAFNRFKVREKSTSYERFLEENSSWLGDYCLFMAAHEHFAGLPWNRWERPLAWRNPQTLLEYLVRLRDEIDYHSFLQYAFFRQWQALKDYAKGRGIKIIGDLPLYISHHSSDVWVNPQYFELDSSGDMAKVAGVPPDHFTATGQLWGNPLYRWEEMAQDNYLWWRQRIKTLLNLVDMIRIDHFRGFEAFWEIPGQSLTAVGGKWVKGPGEKFFATIENYLGSLPVIAEDLGHITPEVVKLKEQLGYPGMEILQFTLAGGQEKAFLPGYYEENCVVYTGTHDNDTLLGWYRKALAAEPQAKKYLKKYFNLHERSPAGEVCWRLIEFAYSSGADTVVIPLQDLLCLNSEARMNYPGTVEGNWRWRFSRKCLTADLQHRLAELVSRYKR